MRIKQVRFESGTMLGQNSCSKLDAGPGLEISDNGVFIVVRKEPAKYPQWAIPICRVTGVTLEEPVDVYVANYDESVVHSSGRKTRKQ